MVKRKRSPSPAPLSAPKPARLKKICTTLLTNAQKPLVVALRHGAALERQKHSRRKKTAVAKNDTKALARIDAEYAVLKGLDLTKLADQHLRRTVGKVKSLKEHEALREYVEGVDKASQDVVTLNVLARLYKVKGVRDPVDKVIMDLKEAVGAGGSVVQGRQTKENIVEKKTKAKVVEKESGDVDMGGLSDEEGDAFAAFSARIAEPSSGEEDSDGSVSDNDRPPSIGDSNSDHDPDADLDAASESSEAASLADFDDDEDNEDDDEDQPKRANRLIAPPSDISDSESDSDSESLKPPKSKSKAEPKFTSSAFLPGLSHAAYYSDPDSSASDLDTTAPRKNRRGQRARQKIAEAKFGAKAKHLQKVERNKGWDAKRGAVSDDRRGRGNRDGVARGRGPQITGENAMPLGKKKAERDDKGTLHPSWQAAKAAKEKKTIKIDLKGKPQGNKVVFD